MSEMTGLVMARKLSEEAGRREHRLGALLTGGAHAVTREQFDGAMRYLSRCPLLPGTQTEEVVTSRTPAATARQTISDIPQGFYATGGRTGSNSLDFWKVRVNAKTGYRSVARVIGGGTDAYPRLVEITRQEQRLALGAILRAGIAEAGDVYAVSQTRCKKCGLQLTDDDSIAARMGPVCRGKE